MPACRMNLPSFFALATIQSISQSSALSIGVADLLDDAHDLVGDLAQTGEAGQEADGERQQPGEDRLDPRRGGADVAGRDRDDRVDERR